MRLLDALKPDKRDDKPAAPSALAAAREPGAGGGPVGGMIQSLMRSAIEGRGPLRPTKQVAKNLRDKVKSSEKAVNMTTRQSIAGAAVGGFVTSLGGFASMPVAIPVNVVEFYVQATRAVGKIAELRGYDVDDDTIRTAIMLTLSGAQADDLMSKVGVTASSNMLVHALEDQLPESALMMINKAVAFRLIRSVGERSLVRVGNALPLIGGVVGAGLDAYLMMRILESAKHEFPETKA